MLLCRVKAVAVAAIGNLPGPDQSLFRNFPLNALPENRIRLPTAATAKYRIAVIFYHYFLNQFLVLHKSFVRPEGSSSL
jgi:hypothetical protein